MKSGTVAVVGRANAGKSTLVNVLVGEKVAIVSPKPQTTRDRILGIRNSETSQIVFEDTPGLYKASSVLNSIMQRSSERSAEDVDLIMFVIDGHEGVKERDLELLSGFMKKKVPLIVVMSKTDIMPKENVMTELEKFADFGVEVVPVSARKGKNLKELVAVIENNLPEGEPLYDENVVSDKSEKFMIAEIMREKLLLLYDKEIPHGVAIIVNEFKLREDGKVYDVNLDIVCERPNHKAIIIGKQGSAIKKASSFAREEMEKFLGKKVFLTTYVKVKEDWRQNKYLIKQLGVAETDEDLR